MEGLLTLTQAAIRLGVTSDYLRVAVYRKKLAAEKVGRDWLVTDEEVERYARERLGKKGRPRKNVHD